MCSEQSWSQIGRKNERNAMQNDEMRIHIDSDQSFIFSVLIFTASCESTFTSNVVVLFSLIVTFKVFNSINFAHILSIYQDS